MRGEEPEKIPSLCPEAQGCRMRGAERKRASAAPGRCLQSAARTGSRSAFAPALFSAAALLFSAAAATAGPCAFARQFQLSWDERSGEGIVLLGLHRCPAPEACQRAKSNALVTQPPLAISARAGGSEIFSVSLPGACTGDACRASNRGGCAGGADYYGAGARGLVRISYPRRGGASVMGRLRAAMARPPADPGGVTVTISDAAGYQAEARFRRCRTGGRQGRVNMMCF